LRDTEINTQILKVLDHGADLNLGVSPAPLRGGVASTMVSLFGPILVVRVISFSHHTCDFVEDLGAAHNAPRGVSLPVYVVKWAMNHTINEGMRAQKENEKN
jgi:hypothetical protein